MRRILWTAVSIAAAIMLAAMGSRSVAAADEKPPAVRIGVVNVMRIMTEMPEYKDLSVRYLEERKQLFKPEGKKKLSDVLKSRENEIKAAEQKWQKKKQDFIDNAMKKIADACAKVQQDKKLSFVLMDAPWYPGYPLRQYGAQDITTDVLFVLQSK